MSSNLTGCKYNIEAVKNECIDCCLNQGWSEPENDIMTGTKNVEFATFQNNAGYSLIKINIPKEVSPCTQSFKLTVDCQEYPNETATSSFDIEVLKKGLF